MSQSVIGRSHHGPHPCSSNRKFAFTIVPQPILTSLRLSLCPWSQFCQLQPPSSWTCSSQQMSEEKEKQSRTDMEFLKTAMVLLRTAMVFPLRSLCPMRPAPAPCHLAAATSHQAPQPPPHTALLDISNSPPSLTSLASLETF